MNDYENQLAHARSIAIEYESSNIVQPDHAQNNISSSHPTQFSNSYHINTELNIQNQRIALLESQMSNMRIQALESQLKSVNSSTSVQDNTNVDMQISSLSSKLDTFIDATTRAISSLNKKEEMSCEVVNNDSQVNTSSSNPMPTNMVSNNDPPNSTTQSQAIPSPKYTIPQKRSSNSQPAALTANSGNPAYF